MRRLHFQNRNDRQLRTTSRLTVRPRYFGTVEPMVPGEYDTAKATRFLAQHGYGPVDVAMVGEGAWSRCFGFRHDGTDLVVRFGAHLDDFEKDNHAQHFARPGLPVPAVLAVGPADGGHYAISTRSFGTPLEHATPAEWDALLPSVLAMFDALRSCTVTSDSRWGMWGADVTGPQPGWRHALLSVADEHPRHRGWHAKLGAHHGATEAFAWGLGLMDEAATDNVPHAVIHSDLINRNVHVVGDQITGVFDWGCSMYGDPLYELAWFQFYAPWCPHLDIDALTAGVLAGDRGGRHTERLVAAMMHIGLGSIVYGAARNDGGDIAAAIARMKDVAAHI